MSVIQATLIALAYAFARASFNAGLGWYVLSQPLVAGTIAGLLLGDPLRGAALGGALNLATLALSHLKLSLEPDIALVGYVGVPLLLFGGLDANSPQATVVLAALVGLGGLLHFLRNIGNTMLAHWADYFADGGEFAAISVINVILAQAWLFALSFIPALLLLRLDQSMVLDALRDIPAWVQQTLQLSQYLLAALGIAMSLRLIMQGSAIAYFVLGWLVAQWLGLVPATMFGASIAIVHAYLARKRMESNKDMLVPDALPSDQSGDDLESPRTLSPASLASSFFLWMFFHDAGQNFERGQHMGFATALTPIGQQVSDTLLERAAFLRRHLTLFVSDWPVGGLLVGATAALEERRANGDAISEAEFAGAKTSVMASLSVLGNVVLIGVITRLFVAIGANLAQRPSLLGPLFFIIAESIVVLGIAVLCFQFGYRQTRHWAIWMRESDWLRAGLFGAVRLGTFVLGALLIVYVPLRMPETAHITIGEATLWLQPLLDQFAPHILSLSLTLWLWWQLRYRRANDMTLMLLCLFGAFALSYLASVTGWV